MDDTKISICRVCLNEIEATEKFYNLFEKYEDLLLPGKEHDDILIVDKLNALSNVDIKEGDGLPDKVCSSCLLELEDAYNFKRKCEKSDYILRLSQTQEKIDIDIAIKEESQLERCYSDEETTPVKYQSDNENSENEEKLEAVKEEIYNPSDAINDIDSSNIIKNVKHNLRFNCEHCNKHLKSECKLRVHLKNEHGIYACRICRKLFESHSVFRYHRTNKTCTDPMITENAQMAEEITTTQSVDTPSNEDLSIDFTQQIDEETDKVMKKCNDQIKPSKAIDLQLECHDCGNVFKSKCKLRVHWKKVHSAFKCNGCQRSFKTYRAYKNHQKLKSTLCRNFSKMWIDNEGGTLVYNCLVCDYNTRTRGCMVQHFKVHDERLFQCDICPKAFTRQHALRYHKESVHKEYVCEKTCHICNKVILGNAKYKYHMQKHKHKSFQCDICKRTFTVKEYLKYHIITHMYKKTYPCDICNRLFYMKKFVAYHKQHYHNRDKHCCSVCGYSLRDPRTIAKHEKRHNGSNVGCNVCGKFYENKTQLSLHMERHVNKTKICVYCNKSFFNRNYLSRHMRLVHNIYTSKGDVLGKVKKNKL